MAALKYARKFGHALIKNTHKRTNARVSAFTHGCIWMHLCTRTRIHQLIWMCVRTHMQMNARTRRRQAACRLFSYKRARTRARTHARTDARTHARTHACMHMHACVHAHTRTHVSTHRCTHACRPVDLRAELAVSMMCSARTVKRAACGNAAPSCVLVHAYVRVCMYLCGVAGDRASALAEYGDSASICVHSRERVRMRARTHARTHTLEHRSTRAHTHTHNSTH